MSTTPLTQAEHRQLVAGLRLLARELDKHTELPAPSIIETWAGRPNVIFNLFKPEVCGTLNEEDLRQQRELSQLLMNELPSLSWDHVFYDNLFVFKGEGKHFSVELVVNLEAACAEVKPNEWIFSWSVFKP